MLFRSRASGGGAKAPDRQRHGEACAPATKQRRYGMRKWQCLVCGFIYEEERGLPSDGIAAGTRWEDIPEDWSCPDCGVDKSDFEMIEL